MTAPPADKRRNPDRRQHRPTCPVCGRWERADHNCPGPPVARPAVVQRRHRVDPILGMRCVA